MEQKLKILVIEDNIDIRENTCEILELAGYEVYQAANGKKGVEMAISVLPDLILCDIMMPELDGYGVLHMLSKRAETAATPFIFLTAKTERLEVRKGMEMGADDYLTKPFGDMELLNAIECRIKKQTKQKAIISESLDKAEKLFSGTKGLEELKKMAAERKIKYMKRKQVIYYEGDTVDGIYLVVSGSVKTFKIAADRRELLTGVFGADEYFGVAAMLSGKHYKEAAEAMEDVALCFLPKSMVEELISRYPDVAAKFIKLLANNVISKEEQLLQLAYYSVRKRMAQLLLELTEKSGQQSIESFNFSRENLASMAGIATETVSRILSDFDREGLITKNISQIVVLDSKKLERMKN